MRCGDKRRWLSGLAVLFLLVLLLAQAPALAAGDAVRVEGRGHQSLQSAVQTQGEDIAEITHLVIADRMLSPEDFVWLRSGAASLITLDISEAELEGNTLPQSALENDGTLDRLKTVVLPEGTHTLMDRAFFGCAALTKVTVGECEESLAGIQAIGAYAFWHAESLGQVNLASAAAIGPYAFADCTCLDITAPLCESYVQIEEGTFAGCMALGPLALPQVRDVAPQAFWGSGLTSLIFGQSLATIGEEAFADCHSLEQVVFTGPTPPKLADTAFLNMGADGVCYVPEGADYEAALALPRRVPYGICDALVFEETGTDTLLLDILDCADYVRSLRIVPIKNGQPINGQNSFIYDAPLQQTARIEQPPAQQTGLSPALSVNLVPLCAGDFSFSVTARLGETTSHLTVSLTDRRALAEQVRLAELADPENYEDFSAVARALETARQVMAQRTYPQTEIDGTADALAQALDALQFRRLHFEGMPKGPLRPGDSFTLSVRPFLSFGFHSWGWDEKMLAGRDNADGSMTFTVKKGGGAIITYEGTLNQGSPMGAFVDARDEMFTITPSVSGNGRIAPEELVQVMRGGRAEFFFHPGEGERVLSIEVDGQPLDTLGLSYAFEDVQGNHRIHVIFSSGSAPHTGDRDTGPLWLCVLYSLVALCFLARRYEKQLLLWLGLLPQRWQIL